MYISYKIFDQFDKCEYEEIGILKEFSYNSDYSCAQISFKGNLADILLKMDKTEYNNLHRHLVNALHHNSAIFEIKNGIGVNYFDDDEEEEIEKRLSLIDDMQHYQYMYSKNSVNI